jgi:ribonuclease HII
MIRDRAVSIGVGAASVREIDRFNIYHASTLAMRRALARLSVSPDHVIIDGKAIRTLTIPHTAVVKGDARCFSIACASIIAKITRDRLMHSLGKRYPTYGWDRNVGYATQDHIAGLATSGITPHHRRSFMRIRQLSFDFEGPADIVIDIPVEALVDELVSDMPASRSSLDMLPNARSEPQPTIGG